MSHNPAPTQTRFRTLRGHRVLTLEGRDATAFAQAQFMNDVAALAPSHWQWNGWLTPKGRVIALFALLKFDEQTLWLLLPDADPADLAAQLQRFVFRSKVKIAAGDTWRVDAALQASEWASGAHFVGDAAAGVELDMGAEGGGRSLRIGPIDEADAKASTDAGFEDAGFEEAWAAEDLHHGLPRLPASQSGLWTPQQLSLEWLLAYSIKKGCYPGQEIVARTHFLGQAKRGVALLETDAPVAIGAEVRDPSRALGSVVSVAQTGATWRLLAVLPLEREGALTLGDGIPARERALAGGLQR
jgi:folate-binding protein YgfZ